MAKPQTAEKSFPINLLSPEFAAIGKKRIEGLISAQSELFEELQEANKHWFDRAQAEASLMSELATKLTAAQSIPDTMAAYQEWISRQMEMTAEDGKYLLADAQKIMQTGARLLSNGWLSNGSGGST